MNVENLAEVPNQTGDESHVLYDLLKPVYIFSNCCRSPTVALGWRVSKWGIIASLTLRGAPSSNHEATGQRLIIEMSTVNNRKVNG